MESNRQMTRKWVVYRTVWLVLGRYRACSLFGDLVFPSRHARDLKGSTIFCNLPYRRNFYPGLAQVNR